MPESPEAQVIVDGLRDLTKDRWITAVRAVGGRYQTKAIPGLTQEFVDSSHPISEIWRHGKAIVFDLTTHDHIIVTLGMTGKFSLNKEKHTAVEFEYGDAHEKRKFYFVDQRRFGTVRIVPTSKLASTLSKIGWDALSEDVDFARVKEAVRSSSLCIGSALMESRIFSGIGNYLRAEILYAARVSPWRMCDELDDEQIGSLCREARRITLRSYELGGNTIENFVNLQGGSGKFFAELKVYGKRMDPNGNEVLAEKTPEGRTIHWVPTVQI